VQKFWRPACLERKIILKSSRSPPSAEKGLSDEIWVHSEDFKGKGGPEGRRRPPNGFPSTQHCHKNRTRERNKMRERAKIRVNTTTLRPTNKMCSKGDNEHAPQHKKPSSQRITKQEAKTLWTREEKQDKLAHWFDINKSIEKERWDPHPRSSHSPLIIDGDEILWRTRRNDDKWDPGC
jgi:hypothetical protein